MTDTMKTHVHLNHPSAFSVSSCMVTALGQIFANSTVKILEMNMVGQVLDFFLTCK